jgi:hypothetical protein
MSWHPLKFVIMGYTTFYFLNSLYVGKTGRKAVFQKVCTFGGA